MMRALALGILLVVNLVLLFWQVMVHKPEAPVPTALPDVGELLLVSELEVAELTHVSEPVPVELPMPAEQDEATEDIALLEQEPETSPAEVIQTAPEPVPVRVAEAEVASESEPADEQEALAGTSPDNAQQAPVDTQTPAPTEPEIAQSPQEAIEETEPFAPTEGTGEHSQAAEQPVEPITPERACWRLGPFDTAAEAVRLAQDLPPGVVRLSVEQATVAVPRGYYVLIPPLASRAEALRIERELKAEGIEDSWVFVAGPLKNAVSLGLFNREVNAQRRLRRVQSKGFEPELRVRHRDAEKAVLLVEGAADETVREALQALGGKNLEVMACPE